MFVDNGNKQFVEAVRKETESTVRETKQTAFAAMVGTSQSQISHFIGGKYARTALRTFERCADFFGVVYSLKRKNGRLYVESV